MKVTLQYFDGCPNWLETQAHFEALQSEGLEFEVNLERIETQEAAEAAGFRGSPTVLVEGVDPFADPEAPVGLSCRVYRGADGYVGSPTIDQLRDAIVASRSV